MLIQSKERIDTWSDDDFLKYKLLGVKNKGKNHNFDIDEEYILELLKIQNNKCIYSGVELLLKTNSQNSLSIDVVDNDLGYVKGNIVLCSSYFNTMKNKYSVDEILYYVTKIYEFNKEYYEN